MKEIEMNRKESVAMNRKESAVMNVEEMDAVVKVEEMEAVVNVIVDLVEEMYVIVDPVEEGTAPATMERK